MGYFYKENKALEQLIDSYFKGIEKYSNENTDGLLSVILLGSLSRGEATWIETKNGPLMVSDIEFFTVYPEGFSDLKGYLEYCKSVANEVFGKDNSSLFHIDNALVCENSLALLERKLLTYDAKRMGKTVVGKDYISLIPEINLKNINLWDIKDILTHRVFSALYYGLPLKNAGNEAEYRYNIAKNSLDLMTVMLVNHKILESGFINRLKIIKTLDIDEKIKNYFEFCLSVKLGSDCDYSFTTKEMEDLFIMLVKDLKKKFRMPLSNVFINAKFVTRRALGIVKRALKYKKLPSSRHLSSLIKSFEQKTPLSDTQKKLNLVINGYPLEK